MLNKLNFGKKILFRCVISVLRKKTWQNFCKDYYFTLLYFFKSPFTFWLSSANPTRMIWFFLSVELSWMWKFLQYRLPYCNRAIKLYTKFWILFSRYTPNGRSPNLPSSTTKKPRRRVATVSQRRAANIRERRRMFNLNEAFDKLRRKVRAFKDEILK